MLETWVRREAALQDPALAPTVRALPADATALTTALRQKVQGRVLRTMVAGQTVYQYGVDIRT